MAYFEKDDQIYISHDQRDADVWEYDPNDPAKKGEHTVWHRKAKLGTQNRLSPSIDYKKIRITKEAIVIDTHGQRVTIPHGPESSRGMHTGKVSDVEPLKP